jgi:hypothetical protein
MKCRDREREMKSCHHHQNEQAELNTEEKVGYLEARKENHRSVMHADKGWKR